MQPAPSPSPALIRQALKGVPRPDLLAQQVLTDWLTPSAWRNRHC